MRLFVPMLALALASTAFHAGAADLAPVRGQTMHSVLHQYGEPQERLAAVGNPPITRWVYPGFTVYFEHRRTIHSVRHHNRRAAHRPAH